MTDRIIDTFWPSCRYHPIHEPRIFNSQVELDAAGPGWVDTPAKLKPPVKERLSKLQKWILQKAYNKGWRAGEVDYRLSKKNIYEDYFGVRCEYLDQWRLRFRFVDLVDRQSVILSRSLKRLSSRDYIRLSRHDLVLTEKGISKAKKLLKV